MEHESKRANTLLTCLSIIHKGNWESTFKAIQNKEPITDDDIQNALSKVNTDYITMLDTEGYPKYLSSLWRPPFVLFYEGDISLIEDRDKNFVIYNSYNASDYANKAVSSLTKEICKKANIVVPFLGKNSFSLCEELLEEDAKIVAVIPKGIESAFSAREVELLNRIKLHGLVISEVPLNEEETTNSRAMSFRLCSHFANNVLVGGVSKTDSLMVGIGFSFQTAKNVFCIPFPIGSKYVANGLIHDGAILAEDGGSVLYDAGLKNH